MHTIRSRSAMAVTKSVPLCSLPSRTTSAAASPVLLGTKGLASKVAQSSFSRLFSISRQQDREQKSFGQSDSSTTTTVATLMSTQVHDSDSVAEGSKDRTAETTGKKGTEPGPLDGIRVLDLTRVLAGPYCTQLLGDLGAEVIKIENPQGGDDTRAWGPPFATNLDPSDPVQESAYFLSVNRNKKSMTVNLRSEAGKKLIHELVQKVDVFVENYVPGKLASLGLGYKDLSALNPRLVYASVTGYGQTGPYSSRPGYDVMIEAEAGLMYITGEEHGPPVKVGVAVTDLTTGLYAHGGILAALFARVRTGRGQHVDCSLLESQVATLANIGSSYLIAGQEAKRMGTAHPSIVPYQVLQTRDSHIMIGAGNDGQFRTLCQVLQLDSLGQNPLYSTNRARVQNREDLIRILTNRLKSEGNKFWIKALEGKGVPFAPINNIGQTFEHAQVLARGMVHEMEHPKAGKIKVVGIPVKYSDTPPSIRTPPPLLGQHTEEVLREWMGYDDERIRGLRDAKAL